MAWVFLGIAGLLEIVWASAMKQSAGFSRLWPSVVTIVAMLASFALLALAMKSLPQSVSYAVWVGIGAVGVAIVGVVRYHERLSAGQWVCLALIAVGIVGMKVLTGPGAASGTPPVNP